MAMYLGSQKVCPIIKGGITPSGTLSITANGTYDVTNYASANVSVSGGGSGIITIPFADFSVVDSDDCNLSARDIVDVKIFPTDDQDHCMACLIDDNGEMVTNAIAFDYSESAYVPNVECYLKFWNTTMSGYSDIYTEF